MDLLDLELIKLLGVDARRSSAKLAKQLHTSAATVRRRIRRLVKSNTIQIHAYTNPAQIGLTLSVLLGLKIDINKVDSIVQTLYDKPGVAWVARTLGRFDIVCSAWFIDNHDLARFLKAELPLLEGVTMTETIVCLEVLARPTIDSSILEGY